MQTENNITGAEFLSDLNVLLSTGVGLNRNVKLALKKLGEHERADQVYIVSINHDMTFIGRMDPYRGVCFPGVRGETQFLL